MKKLFRKLSSKRKKGFTLIELLAVVIILGVLTAIAVPTYQKVIQKSRVSDGLNVLDMLAGAQDKYFIENGQYAQNVTDLKAPFKEYRTGGPYEDIVTTNFTYDNIQGKNCLRAVSNIGGTYTLVKNYRDKEKTFCVGQDCNRLTDFVEEKPEGELNSLCPDDQNQQCALTDSDCPGNQVVIGTGANCYCDCASIPQCNQGQTFNDVRCQCECPASAQATCDAQGLTMDPNTCECIPGGGGGCLDPVPEDRIEKCDNGNPNTECGTKTIKHICDESTGWHVQELVSICENVSSFGGTVNCDAEGWKHGCGVKTAQGTCELNSAGTQYEWHLTGYGECHYANPSYNCGAPGWLAQLGNNEVCRYCQKQQCTSDFPIALKDKDNCLGVNTDWYGYIKTTTPSTYPFNPNTPKKCFNCQTDPVAIDNTKCPRQIKCRNTGEGEGTTCKSYSNDQDLINLCTGGEVGLCYRNDNLCQRQYNRLVHRNIGTNNCSQYCNDPTSCPKVLYFWEIEHKVLRCLAKWPVQ